MAQTVYSSFSKVYGLPQRVRTDGGGENVDVWQHMMQQHRDASAVIVGSLVHNVCIERMWRDVCRGVIDIVKCLVG